MTMRFPVDQFDTQWNTTAGYGFGVQTSYGFHEGIDLNDNNGGNADLGKPLYAIADYEVTSIHDHATGFGKHIHYLIKGDFGERYVHYAHCNEIFVTVGQKGKEGDKIATVGNTGNSSYAHLHMAIKKRPTGIDGIAKTQADLEAYENPIDFIRNNMGQSSDQQAVIDELRAARDTNWNLYQAQIAETGLKQERIAELEVEVSELKTSKENLTKDLSTANDKASFLLQELEKENNDDKKILDELLDEQHKNQPLKDELQAIRMELDTPIGDVVEAIRKLKASKTPKFEKPTILKDRILLALEILFS